MGLSGFARRLFPLALGFQTVEAALQVLDLLPDLLLTVASMEENIIGVLEPVFPFALHPVEAA